MAVSALVLDALVPVRVGALTLTERGVLAAQRVGLDPVRVRSAQAVEPPAASGRGERLMVIGPNLLFEPSALAALAAETTGSDDDRALVVADSEGPLLALLPRAAAVSAAPHSQTSIEEIVRAFSDRGLVHDVALAGRFCRRVGGQSDAPGAERAYLRHTNGGTSESFFTKIIRRFSVPLSPLLVRIGATPTQVTVGGLALAVASAWCLAQGRYAAGLLGAVLYYASMVFDCSDGEVARLTLRDSRFGAWLETMVDYLTYFLVLGALTFASLARGESDAQIIAAFIALIGSIIVGLAATFLRHRVAAADPGQFDDSSAKVLASASGFGRFARWGRQWIKRSSMAHLIVALALVNQLPVLLYLWAFGASLASVMILGVGPFVIRRAAVTPVKVPDVRARS